MASKLEVFNGALLLIEEPPLTSADENNNAGRTIRSMYESSVRACLENGAWNFSVTRVQLQQVLPAPAYHYSYYYGLPADNLRILSLHDTADDRDGYIDWREERGKIASSASALYLRYVSRNLLEMVGNWPQVFADYVSGDLALRVGPRLKSSGFDYRIAKAEFERREGNALAFDAQNAPPKRWNQGRWVRAGRSWQSTWGRTGRG